MFTAEAETLKQKLSLLTRHSLVTELSQAAQSRAKGNFQTEPFGLWAGTINSPANGNSTFHPVTPGCLEQDTEHQLVSFWLSSSCRWQSCLLLTAQDGLQGQRKSSVIPQPPPAPSIYTHAGFSQTQLQSEIFSSGGEKNIYEVTLYNSVSIV